jgi:hypothetical protein
MEWVVAGLALVMLLAAWWWRPVPVPCPPGPDLDEAEIAVFRRQVADWCRG